jgi:antitoxin component YwqK of YwqJK toxin-antitoxin module
MISENQKKEVIMKYTIIMLSIIFITGVGTCFGIDQSICTPGSVNSFHPNGRLKSCTLKDNFVINGVTCKQYEPVTLYGTGMLKSCVISEYFNYNAITCNQHGQISFYETGILDSCILSKTIQIEGKTCE